MGSRTSLEIGRETSELNRVMQGTQQTAEESAKHVPARVRCDAQRECSATFGELIWTAKCESNSKRS